MKYLFCLSILIFWGCNNQVRQPEKNPVVDTTPKVQATNETNNATYYLQEDSLVITSDIGMTLKYGKQEFNKIIDDHPEFVREYIGNPDEVYYAFGQHEPFGSETGKDIYYNLYAYFLKNKNGDKKYAERRRQLTNLYVNINSLFQHFEYGGTYFSHQFARIPGYVEYSVYLFKFQETNDVSKTYDITKQKELYIKSLRQLITDENSIDFNTLGKEKTERTKTLHKIVDAIEKAITDNYSLRRAQAFHYEHYQYY